MPHFFKSIRIRNLLSFGPDSPELVLKPINIVIGPNGSGKSNLLAALWLLSEPGDIFDPVIPGGIEWKWNHEQQSRAFIEIETEEKKYPCEYHVGKNYQGVLGSSDSAGKHIQSFSDLFFFRDWQYGPTAPVRSGPQPIDLSSERLRTDGRNLAHVVKRIRENEQSNAKFMEFLTELYEDISDVTVEEAHAYYFLYVLENEQKRRVERISDGTLRYLALLAILCDPEPPKLICLEEPELGLHPDLIHVIARAIRYASERTQIIATTHSVSLVDDFTDMPESIVVCEKIDGSTELRRLDLEEMAPFLAKRHRLGELWTSGLIGGNRW